MICVRCLQSDMRKKRVTVMYPIIITKHPLEELLHCVESPFFAQK